MTRPPDDWLWIDPDDPDLEHVQHLPESEVKADWAWQPDHRVVVLIQTPLLRVEAVDGKISAIWIHKSLIEEKK